MGEQVSPDRMLSSVISGGLMDDIETLGKRDILLDTDGVL